MATFIFSAIIRSCCGVSSPASREGVLFVVGAFLYMDANYFIHTFPVRAYYVHFICGLSQDQGGFVCFVTMGKVSNDGESFSNHFAAFRQGVSASFVSAKGDGVADRNYFYSLVIMFRDGNGHIFSNFDKFRAMGRKVNSLGQLPIRAPLVEELNAC